MRLEYAHAQVIPAAEVPLKKQAEGNISIPPPTAGKAFPSANAQMNPEKDKYVDQLKIKLEGM